MSTETIATLILVGGFFFLTLIRVPIAFAMGISTVVTTIYLQFPPEMIVTSMLRGVNSFSIMAIPFFILAGEIMNAGGIADRLVRLSRELVGSFRGGLAIANCVDSAFFGGISGSPSADTAALGPIMIPMMVKSGYSVEFSTCLTMSTAVEGCLIPPSHNLIIYAMAASSVSIAALLVAGLIPGLLLGLIFAVYCCILAVVKKFPKGDKFSIKRLIKVFADAFWGLLAVLIIVVGVTSGICTPTEAAALSCVWAFIVSFFIYRKMNIKAFWNSLGNAAKTLFMFLFLLVTSSGFGWVLAYLKIPDKIAHGLLSISTSPIFIMLILNLIMLFLGCIMDMTSIMIISTPILLPIAQGVGIDAVQFGIIMMLNLGIGLLTPPVGGVLFIGSSISGVKIEKLARNMLPFYAVMIFVLMLITFIPDISLWLPRTLGLM